MMKTDPKRQGLAPEYYRIRIGAMLSCPVPGFYNAQKVLQVARGSQLSGLQGSKAAEPKAIREMQNKTDKLGSC